jgi:hypothetical protein
VPHLFKIKVKFAEVRMPAKKKLKKGKKVEATKTLSVVSPRDAAGGLPAGRRVP